MIYLAGLSYKNFSTLSNRPRDSRISRKKFQSAEAMRILSLLEGRTIEENDIVREIQGRPFLIGGEIDFNTANSGDLVAVSYAKGENLRTGCDIELIRPRTNADKIAEIFFSDSEKNYLFLHGKFNITRFYEIWTLKECYLKLKGLSVFDMKNCPSFINNDNISASLPVSFRVYELFDGADNRYIFAAAIEGADHSPEIRWFSPLTLNCKIRAEIKKCSN